MNVYRYFAVRPLSALLALVTLVNNPAWSVQTIEFNTDFLDVKDGRKIDLSDFSRADYLMPGQYQMVVRINKNELREQNITFMPPEDDPKGSVPCLTSDLVKQLGFTAAASRELRWWKNGQCLKLDSLKGMSAHGDLGSSSLYLNVPQAYLEYVADNRDPPPPFGATVVNKKRYQTGIVNDNGSVWIIGIKPGETMQCTYFGMAKRSVPFLCPNGYRR